MSIAQQIMSNPGRYSIQQLQHAMDSGMVPAYIAIPLIQQKTEEAKMSQMVAQGGQAPQEGQPTVAEQVLQEADQGIPALPSNLPPGYAPGGIVAFDEGGDVPRYAAGDVVEDEDDKEFDSTPAGLMSLLRKSMSGAGGAPDLAQAVEAIRGLRAPADDTSTQAIKDYIAKQSESASQRAQQQRAYRILELAGRIGAGKSQFGIQNVGEALAATAPGFAQDEQAQEKEQLQNLMLQSQLEQQRRAQETGDITGGISLYGHQADLTGKQAGAMARLGSAISKLGQTPKDTDFRTSVNNKFDELRTKMELGLIPTPKDKSGKPLTGEPLEKIIRGMATDKVMEMRQYPQILGVGSRERTAEQDLNQRVEAQLGQTYSRVADDVRAEFADRKNPLAKQQRQIRTDYGDDAAITFAENAFRRRFNNDPSVPKDRHLPLLPEPWKKTAPQQPGQAAPAATKPATSNLVAPQAAIKYLKANDTPSMRQAFDAKYGQGAAARALGK